MGTYDIDAQKRTFRKLADSLHWADGTVATTGFVVVARKAWRGGDKGALLMAVGLLPALGGGLSQLAATGQASRLIDGYLRPYARAFDRLFYFSYFRESFDEYTDDPDVLARARLLCPGRRVGRGLRGVSMPLAHATEFRSCEVLRVFQVTGVLPAIIANALFGVPYVTGYGFWYGELSQPGFKTLLRAVIVRLGLRRAAAVIVPTEELRARVSTIARRVCLIPNGVDTSRFMPGHRPSEPLRRILYVGRFEPEKNLATLVAAAAKLPGQFSVRLTFIGAGAQEAELRAQAEALGVVAEFAGVVDHRYLPERYRGAATFVLPSFSEGHPKALIEAMASGLPCVASDRGGNRALVRDGETGLLFDPLSPDALASALERVLSEESFASALGHRAREMIATEYDLGMLVDREIRLLKEVARSCGR